MIDRVARKISPAAAGYSEYRCRCCNAAMSDPSPCDHLAWWCVKTPKPPIPGGNGGFVTTGKGPGTADPKASVSGRNSDQWAQFQEFLAFQKLAASGPPKIPKDRRVKAGAFAALMAAESGSEEESD